MKAYRLSQYINMVRNIAWSFHRTTGIEWEELFSEAMLAYTEMITNDSYNPDKAKRSTWIYSKLRNHLITFCNQQKRFVSQCEELPIQPADVFERLVFLEQFEFNDDLKTIINMILDSPHEYLMVNKVRRNSVTTLKKQLRKIGWNYSRIGDGMREIRQVLNVKQAIIV